MRRRPCSTPASPRCSSPCDDPNPEAAGGADKLREAGVEVVRRGRDAARRPRAPCGRGCTRSAPAVRSSPGSTRRRWTAGLPPRICGPRSGSPRRSRGPTCTSCAATVDAILVGSGTVLADDPQLTVRDDDGTPAEHQPLRVVLDRRHRMPQSARVLDQSAETLVLDTAVPRFALKALFDRGVRHVLLEGGPTLAGAFVEARCVDEVVAYLAPKLLGDGPARPGRGRDRHHRRGGHTGRRGRSSGSATTSRSLGRADLAAKGSSGVFTGIIEEIGEVARRRASAAIRPCCASAAPDDRRRPRRTARPSRSTGSA